ncbi:ABC transporter ATP-binding protein [Pseudanabaena mucicola]|uniref:ABC transporter ATP-binding protein n=1 Tax=Pseudanabaena mucicola FACHB-723 TaxID=2692860 RepID=A0ABR8A0T8_9CYAN|nr:ABC transporter ATP-binding protein [Pseudanabaena mucicola]MBD2189846.1 ABC transporter ATP-binding protein [Pseudanabaena mucicola FACHB-723]
MTANFWDIARYFKRYRQTAIWSITGSSLFEIVDLIVPYAVGQILNVISGRALDREVNGIVTELLSLVGQTVNPTSSLVVLLSLIFVVTVVRAPLQVLAANNFHWKIALETRRDQTQKAIAKILTLPIDFYDENNPGRIAGRVARGLANHMWSYPEIAGQLIPKLVRIIGIFVIIFAIAWWISVFFLVSFILVLWGSLHKLKELTKIEETLDVYQENTESRTSEIITNIKTVKAFANEAKEYKRQSDRLVREAKVSLWDIHIGYVKLGMVRDTVLEACQFVVFGAALFVTFDGRMSIGHFITISTLASMAYSEIRPICLLSEVFARRYSSMLRFHEFMKQDNGQDAAISLHPDTPYPQYHFDGKVEFRNLIFGYDRDRPVLDKIQFTIEPYETVALVGRSGSGKSTLVKLLFRYFDPASGGILIDGTDIRELDITGYRKRLAIVHQEVDIFNGTLMDNLTYGNPKATYAQVQEACAIASVDEFLHLLPRGYNTTVGERGVRLSGGQRQRLGIARALLVNPDILIFDEATSSLDYESERSIQLAMRRIQGTRTTIVIAHRLSTVREADKIVVLDQGKIVEIGSHQQLLAQGGIYHRLHSLQETGELI